MNDYQGMCDLCCVSIALWDCGTPVLGVVYRFACDELFEGIIDNGARLNGASIKPAFTNSIAQAVLATGLPTRGSHAMEALALIAKRMHGFKKTRMLGTATLMATFVACGRVDVYMEDGIMLWDIAAAAAIVKAAGGVATIHTQEDYRCHIQCFASKALLEDFHVQGL
jgi:myo-inositol-1(or 4)-monophosphatase